MFASPALISAVLQTPALQNLPLATQRAIGAGAVTGGGGGAALSGASTPAGTYSVTTNGVNVRSAADATSHINGTLSAGDVVVTDGTEQNGYSYITGASGQDGWVASQFLTPASPLPQDLGPATSGGDLTPGAYQANAAGVAVRSAPSTQAPQIGTLAAGDSVTVTDGVLVNYFTAVTLSNGTAGWVAAFYLAPAGAAVGGGGGGSPGLPVLVLPSFADTLQLRAILVAWDASVGQRGYGSPADMANTPEASAAQIQEVAAFQAWHNSTGQGVTLSTTGEVDPSTRAALLAWTANAVTGANAPPPGQITRDFPGPNPPPNPPPVVQQPAPAAPSNSGPLLVIAAAVIAGVILVEQKKKKKQKRAA